MQRIGCDNMAINGFCSKIYDNHLCMCMCMIFAGLLIHTVCIMCSA